MATVVVSKLAKNKDKADAEDFYTGVLQKQTPDFRKVWHSRFFVLNRGILKYYKSEDDYKKGLYPKGVINFQ